MTLPQNVKDALSRVQMMVDSESEWADINLADWQTIRAHLLSQDAEIERLSQESAQQFIRARDWAELSGKNEDRASLAESRLAAANALLRFMRTRFDAHMDDSDRASIDAHLSENTHDRA